MMENLLKIIRKFINFFHQFFITLYVFELVVSKKNLLRNRKYFVLSNKGSIKKKQLYIDHFKKNKKKIERFKYAKFFGIEKNNKIACYCWAGYKGTNNWHVAELNKFINFKNSTIIFDVLTLPEFRNKRYYQDLLKYTQNNFLKKKMTVYVHSTNTSSLKATKKANFKKIAEMKKFN